MNEPNDKSSESTRGTGGSKRVAKGCGIGCLVAIALVVLIGLLSPAKDAGKEPRTTTGQPSTGPALSSAASSSAKPAPYHVVSVSDASFAGRHRVALRVVIEERSASPAQIHAALLDACRAQQDADAVMAFGYWPGDDIGSAFTAGRLEWAKDGQGWDGNTPSGADGIFTE